LAATTLSNCLAAAIEDCNESQLKLKGIALYESPVKHVEAMAKGELFPNRIRCPIDPPQGYSPCLPPLLAVPNDIATPHSIHPFRLRSVRGTYHAGLDRVLSRAPSHVKGENSHCKYFV
jgi:hypothetical protein